jgi:hypothetical protein
MKRSELLRLIAPQAQVSFKDAGAVLDALTGLMEDAIKTKGSFDFPEIGLIAPAIDSTEVSLAGMAMSPRDVPAKPLADLVSDYVAAPASPMIGGWGGAFGGDQGIFQGSLNVPLGGLTGQGDVAPKSLKSSEMGIRINPETKKPIL